MDEVTWPKKVSGMDYDELKRVLIDESGGTCRGRYEGCLGELHNDLRTHIDHTFPRTHGGRNWKVNLRAICCKCNLKKGDRIQFIVLGDCAAYFGCFVMRPLVVCIAAHPYATLAVVGGVATVAGVYFATRWLREEVDGERRYVRIGRAVKTEAQQRAERTKDAAKAIGTRTSELAKGVAGGALNACSAVTERACEGAANVARGLASRFGSVKVPVP